MRKILFRGKQKDNNKWIYGDLIHIDNLVFITPTNSWCDLIQNQSCILDIKEVIPETVGQFTCIKDKNRGKVFEGDIIKTQKGYIEEISYDSITFNLLMAQATSPDGKCADFFVEDNPLNGIEIIGNVFDNKDLI